SLDVGDDEAENAGIEQPGDVGIVAAAHPDERRDAAAEGGLYDVPNGFKREQRVLGVDEEEIVTGFLRDTGNFSGLEIAHHQADGERTVLELRLGSVYVL